MGGGNNKNFAESKLDSAILLDSAYIAFLDPDDFLEQNTLSHIAEILSKNQIDTFISNQFFSIIGEQKSIFDYKIFKRSLENRIFSQNELLRIASDTIITSIGAFVIKAEILQSVRFDENICYGEDVVFCTEATLKSRTIYIDGRAIYSYRIRENSAVRDESKAKIIAKANSMFFVAEYFYKKLQADSDETMREFYVMNITKTIKALLSYLQRCGYNPLKFTKQDLAKFLPYIDFKRKIAFHFPRIYGFPKKIRKKLKRRI